MKAHLTAPTIPESSSRTITYPRNGFALPSLRFLVSPHVGLLPLYRQIKKSLTMVVIRISLPYCTSNSFASLVVIPQCSFLWHSRARRLERSTVVESEPFYKEAIYHTVSEVQRSPFVSLLMDGYRAVALVVAPTPFVAANFILLGRIIRRLGPQYSRLTPTLCKSDKLS